MTCAPRARISVNASWPGVSRNTTLRSLTCHRVRADVLRDAAGFALGDARLADRVEQRGLAVIDVAHDRDDRRARDEIFGRIDVLGLDLQQLLFEGLHLDVGAELARDHRGGLGRRACC